MIFRTAFRIAAWAWLAVMVVGPSTPAGAEPVVVTDDRDADLRVFRHSGSTLFGVEALQAMEHGDALVAWVAGNQFFAMADVARAFQKSNPAIDVGVVTLPPGLLLRAIRDGGLAYRGHSFQRLPDIYGSVSTAHLAQTGSIRSYVTYMHNGLELMVATGNPKGVTDLHDLVRPDVRVDLPNALNEGIMQVYAKPILVRMGLWRALSPGEDCLDCDPVAHVHFTRVHHREIPARIRAGTTDVGLVWRTEGIAARAEGGVDAVQLPAGQNAIDEVAYVAGMLENSRQPATARAFLAFLISEDGQAAYGSFGFVQATPEERRIRSLEPG